MKKVILISLAITLASCGQSHPQTPATGPKTGHLNQLALSGDLFFVDARTLEANGGYTYFTAATAVSQLSETGVQFSVPAKAPTWVDSLLDGSRRFVPGALALGTPIEVASPVDLSAPEGDTRISQKLISQLGNAVLIPLVIRDGRVVGLARIPLYRKSPVTLDNTEFILFAEPVRSLAYETDAEQIVSGGLTEVAPAIRVTGALVPADELVPVDGRVSLETSVVFAVALAGDGATYSPFDFRWAVVPQIKDSASITLVPAGIPDYYTSQGELIARSSSAVTAVKSMSTASYSDAQFIQQSFAAASMTESRLSRKRGGS